jgi:phage terminase small subunit
MDIGILKNPKHELFAQGLAVGETADRAYELAGYEPDRGNAARLTANDSILMRVKELQEQVAERTLDTIESIIAELNALKNAATENKQLSVGVSAIMGKAKILGFLKDKHEITGKYGGELQATKTTNERRLAALALLLARKD